MSITIANQKTNPEYARTRRLRAGPISVAGVGVLRRNGRILLTDGTKGRIAACEGSEHQCTRLVVLTDDLRTRVIEGVITDAHVSRVVYDGGLVSRRYRDGGYTPDRRHGSGEWIVDVLRGGL